MHRSPRSLTRITTHASFLLVLMLAALGPAEARRQGSYTMEILVDGTPLEELVARSTTYVEALEGREYSIRLRNRTSRRVAVALSVDGLNTIDAKTTTAGDGSKWILGPHQTITLDGWQTSSAVARRFFFTTEQKSYGAWLGKTQNLGVVSAAFFRERQPAPAPIAESRDGSRRRAPLKQDAEHGRVERSSAGEPSRADSDHTRESRAELKSLEESAPLSDELAATGIGREVGHRVQRVRFKAESRPAALFEIRYEYHDGLVRLGVLPRYAEWQDPLERRERARGFEEFEFAPDPF